MNHDATDEIQDLINERDEMRMALEYAIGFIKKVAKARPWDSPTSPHEIFIAHDWLDMFGHLVEPVKPTTRATGDGKGTP